MKCKSTGDYEFATADRCIVCQDEASCEFSKANSTPIVGVVILGTLFVGVVLSVLLIIL